MCHSDQHEFIHQIYNLSSWHESLLEGFDTKGECCRVHEHCALWRKVAHDLLDVTFEIAL